MVAEQIKARGRVFVLVHDLPEEGDVVHYFQDGHRWRYCGGRRGGKAAAVRVMPHHGEEAQPRWVPMRAVVAVYRWHRKTQGALPGVR